jgi:MerR family transcriptional regulator, light-induced transcriptional regulator
MSVAQQQVPGQTQAVPGRTAPSDDRLTLSVAEAAARVGLTAATLRTWDRRYGLSPSERTPGGHRRYSGADLDRLRHAAHLIDTGVPPAQAVAASSQLPSGSIRPQRGRPGGGRVVAIPGGSHKQRGLARAAMALDEPGIRSVVAELLREHGVVAAWTDVLVPVLQAVGDRWSQTQEGVEIEHVMAGGIRGALNDYAGPVAGDERPVVLASVPEEQHSLPLLALHVALAERNVPSVLLGARVPREALVDAVQRLRPRRLVLWAQLRELADDSIVDILPVTRPPLQVIFAGPGWSPDQLVGRMRPESLNAAVEAIVAA